MLKGISHPEITAGETQAEGYYVLRKDAGAEVSIHSEQKIFPCILKIATELIIIISKIQYY